MFSVGRLEYRIGSDRDRALGNKGPPTAKKIDVRLEQDPHTLAS